MYPVDPRKFTSTRRQDSAPGLGDAG